MYKSGQLSKKSLHTITIQYTTALALQAPPGGYHLTRVIGLSRTNLLSSVWLVVRLLAALMVNNPSLNDSVS